MPGFKTFILLVLSFFLLATAGVQAKALITSGKLNINTASAEELLMLKGIGKKTADKIISSRKAKPFKSLDDLLARKLVSKKMFGGISKFLTVNETSSYVTNDKTAGATSKTTKTTKTPSQNKTGSGESSSKVKAIQGPFEKFSGDIYWLPDKQFFQMLSEKIRESKESAIITTFVYKTSQSPRNLAVQLAELLGDAKKRGVDVQVILENADENDSLNIDNQQAQKLLEKQGVDVRFDSPKTTLHAKTAVIDKRWVFIGSHNLTHSALFLNKEASLLIDSPELAESVAAYAKGIR